MPENSNPLKPAPWLQDLVRDRPAPVIPEVKAPVTPVVPPVVPDLKKEISNIDEKAIDAEPAPSLEPVKTEPVVPAATAPVTTEAPAAVAPTVPLNPPVAK